MLGGLRGVAIEWLHTGKEKSVGNVLLKFFWHDMWVGWYTVNHYVLGVGLGAQTTTGGG